MTDSGKTMRSEKLIRNRTSDRAKSSKRVRKSFRKPPTYFVIAVELDESVQRRLHEKPHIYLAKTVATPEQRLAQLQRGAGPEFASGHYRRLVPLPINARPTTDPKKADELLKSNLEAFIRQGHAVNNLASSLEDEWVVYVLALSEEGKENQMRNRNGTRKRGYVYIGQTSNPLEVRVAQHRGEKLSRSNRHLGARPTRNRSFEVVYHELVYTASHALERERQLADEYERKNFLVEAGEATPRKLRRKMLKETGTQSGMAH